MTEVFDLHIFIALLEKLKRNDELKYLRYYFTHLKEKEFKDALSNFSYMDNESLAKIKGKIELLEELENIYEKVIRSKAIQEKKDYY